MNINKVEDKPLVIHTKQKTKIHVHETKSADIKGSNIYTVNRSPKIKAVTTNKESGKARNDSSEFRKQKVKKTYRKSTIHGTDNVRERGIGKFRKNVKEANQSIKVKQTYLHFAGRTGAIGAKTATDQMEGGREVQQAAYMAHEAFRPVIGTTSQGARIFKKKVMEQKKRRII